MYDPPYTQVYMGISCLCSYWGVSLALAGLLEGALIFGHFFSTPEYDWEGFSTGAVRHARCVFRRALEASR